MPTLREIDEALDHAREVEPAERGPAWTAYVDSLLEQRALHEHRETRVLHPAETR